MPFVRVKIKSLFLVLFRIVLVDTPVTMFGLPIEPCEKDVTEVAVRVNPETLASLPFGKADAGANVSKIVAISVLDNPVMSIENTMSVPASSCDTCCLIAVSLNIVESGDDDVNLASFEKLLIVATVDESSFASDDITIDPQVSVLAPMCMSPNPEFIEPEFKTPTDVNDEATIVEPSVVPLKTDVPAMS